MINILPEWETNNFDNEMQFQAKSIMILSQLFPRLRFKVWHTLNEGYITRLESENDSQYRARCAKEGNRNKAQGVVPGLMDIFVLQNGILYKIELKQPGKGLSDAQKILHPIWVRDCPQIPPVVCHTIAQVIRYVIKIQELNLKIDFSPLKTPSLQ